MTFCPHCEEPILASEDTANCNGNERGIHIECLIRNIQGSVGHQRRECGCYGKNDTSEDGLTKRQAAIAAHREYFLIEERKKLGTFITCHQEGKA